MYAWASEPVITDPLPSAVALSSLVVVNDNAALNLVGLGLANKLQGGFKQKHSEFKVFHPGIEYPVRKAL